MKEMPNFFNVKKTPEQKMSPELSLASKSIDIATERYIKEFNENN